MNERPGLSQKKSFRAIIVILLIWVLIALVPDGFFDPLRHILAPIAKPFQGFVSWLAFETGDLSHFTSSISGLKTENENLRRDKLFLEQEVARLREAKEENEQLRKEFALPVDGVTKSLSAEVIGRDTNGLAMSFIINRGSADGIQKGMPVVVGGSNVVGRIKQAYITSSEVELLSHPDSTVAGRVAGTSIQGVIRGDHGLGLMLDMALSSETLQTGQSVVTTGLGDGFPKGLLIGHIKEVRPSADRLFQQASIVAPVTMYDIRFVSVLFSGSI